MKTRVCFFIFIFFIGILPTFSVLLAEESSTHLQGIDQKLTILEVKINHLSSVQTQIVQKQAEMKQELDTLRIWIRRK